jgi:hypothetical protein
MMKGGQPAGVCCMPYATQPYRQQLDAENLAHQQHTQNSLNAACLKKWCRTECPVSLQADSCHGLPKRGR